MACKAKQKRKNKKIKINKARRPSVRGRGGAQRLVEVAATVPTRPERTTARAKRSTTGVDPGRRIILAESESEPESGWAEGAHGRENTSLCDDSLHGKRPSPTESGREFLVGRTAQFFGATETQSVSPCPAAGIASGAPALATYLPTYRASFSTCIVTRRRFHRTSCCDFIRSPVPFEFSG